MKSIVSTDRPRTNTISPPQNLCECPGCDFYRRALERQCAQLAAEVDRLRRERGEGQRAA